MSTNKVDIILAQEYGEMIGRVRTAKWILFLMRYKDIDSVKETVERMVTRDVNSDLRLTKLERY